MVVIGEFADETQNFFTGGARVSGQGFGMFAVYIYRVMGERLRNFCSS